MNEDAQDLKRGENKQIMRWIKSEWRWTRSERWFTVNEDTKDIKRSVKNKFMRWIKTEWRWTRSKKIEKQEIN